MKTFKPDFFQVIITSLFNALVLIVPLFFMFTTEELFEFNKMVLVYLFTFLILIAWGVRMIVFKQFIFRKSKLDIPILMFVFSQLLSTLFSIHPYTSLLGYYSRFHGGLLSTFAYVALYYAFISNIESKQIKGFLYSALGAGFLVSVYGILEHFGHSFSCYLVSNGQSFGTECWIQDVKNRVFATFGQPNWLAAYLITLLPTAIYLAQSAKQHWQKSIWIVLSSLLFVTVLYTRSRSGILGMGIGLALYASFVSFIWWREREWRPKAILRKHRTLITILSICIVLFSFIEHPFSPNLSKYFTQPTPAPITTEAPAPAPAVNRLEEGGSDSGEIRKIVWKGAFDVWKRYPILGSGVETFAYSYYKDRPIEHNQVSEWDFLYNKAHNEFLNYLATTGLVGFLSYCLLLGAFFYLTTRRVYFAMSIEKYDRALLYASLLAGVAALCVSNFFGFSTVMVATLMFLYFAISEVFDVSLAKPFPEVTSLSNWQYTGLVALSVIGILGLYSIYSYHRADIAYTRAKALFGQGQLEPALDTLALAITKNPKEALFYDTLANEYATYALHFANAGLASQAAELSQRADLASKATLDLNDRQLNYYKSRARILINLAQLDPSYLPEAEETLWQAHNLAPTDPKLVYNLGLVKIWQQKVPEGIEDLQESIRLKPDYELPRIQLALALEQQQKYAEALEEWQYILENLNANNTQAQEKIASLSATLKKE